MSIVYDRRVGGFCDSSHAHQSHVWMVLMQQNTLRMRFIQNPNHNTSTASGPALDEKLCNRHGRLAPQKVLP
jgi:hypothetical protein